MRAGMLKEETHGRALVRLRDFTYILDVFIRTFGRARTNLGRAAGRDPVTVVAEVYSSRVGFTSCIVRVF